MTVGFAIKERNLGSEFVSELCKSMEWLIKERNAQIMPITVGRPSTQKLINVAYRSKQSIVVVCQIQAETEEPDYNDLFHIGVIAKILRVFEMPGGNSTVILQSNGPKITLDEITSFSPYMSGKVTPVPETKDEENIDEFKALTDTCKELTTKFIEKSDKLSPDTVFAIKLWT